MKGKYHIYAFGSVCRGEIDTFSDIDLLAVSNHIHMELDSNQFSIYSYQRLKDLWMDGNPFAWHLAFESKMIYSGDGTDFIAELEIPNEYKRVKQDCERFYCLFDTARQGLEANSPSYIFELSNIYLAIRNFATCFALGFLGRRKFSRNSAFDLNEQSLNIDNSHYDMLMKARFLCTRGIGTPLEFEKYSPVIKDMKIINDWMLTLKNQL